MCTAKAPEAAPGPVVAAFERERSPHTHSESSIPGQRPICSPDLRGVANPDERVRWREVKRWSALCSSGARRDMAFCACIPLWTQPSCLYYSWLELARRYSPGGRSSLPFCRRAPGHATWILNAGCDMPQCSAVTAEQIQLLRFCPRVIACSGHDTRTPWPRSEGERATGSRVRRGLQISSPPRTGRPVMAQAQVAGVDGPLFGSPDETEQRAARPNERSSLPRFDAVALL